MKKILIILLFYLKMLPIYPQSAGIAHSTTTEINEPIQLNGKSLSSAELIRVRITEINKESCTVYSFCYDFGTRSIKAIQQVKPVAKDQQTDNNVLNIKVNSPLEKNKIDLLFKHSFTTKQSLVILFVPMGKIKWPFGKA